MKGVCQVIALPDPIKRHEDEGLFALTENEKKQREN